MNQCCGHGLYTEFSESTDKHRGSGEFALTEKQEKLAAQTGLKYKLDPNKGLFTFR